MKNWYEIGMLMRSEFRRELLKRSLNYKEDKGFLDSLFIVEGDIQELQQLNKLLDYWRKN